MALRFLKRNQAEAAAQLEIDDVIMVEKYFSLFFLIHNKKNIWQQPTAFVHCLSFAFYFIDFTSNIINNFLHVCEGVCALDCNKCRH